jgi:hypothetical protein
LKIKIVEEYLNTARDKYQYSGEQALGLLYWHRYEVSKALHDLGNFTPHPEEWTVEDKVLFEQAFQFHGKAFEKIRQMVSEIRSKRRFDPADFGLDWFSLEFSF